MQTKPNDTYELAKLKTLTKTVEDVDIPKLHARIADMQAKMGLLESFLHPISRDDFNTAWGIVRYPQLLMGT